MTLTFDASMSEIGVFLSSAGFVLGFMQGVAVPYLVPAVLSDEQAVQLGLLVSCAQMTAYGAAPSLRFFYLAMLIFSPASIYGPSLKSLLVKCAGAEQQGALQGALSSLRTATAGVGSVLFTLTYSSSMDLAPSLKGSPFFLASSLYCLAAVYFNFLQTRSLRSLTSFDEAVSTAGAAPLDGPCINSDPEATALSASASASVSSSSATVPSWSLGLAGLIGVPRSSSGDEEQQRLLTKNPFTSPAPSTTKGAGTASQRPRYSSGNLSRSLV
jgi:hypothetical protein